MKKLVMTLVVALVAAIAASAASADPNAYCGSSATGCESAFSNTECAGHGAFGGFGPGNDFRGGANGQLTGYLNSALCCNGGGGTAP